MPGHIIKHYRELKNYSQKYVAAKMGISQNSYSKIENNITQLTVHHIKDLSKILDIPLTDFLRDDFEIHKPVLLSKNVSKTELLEKIKLLEAKLETKHAVKHESYTVIMSLITAAEHPLSLVH